MGNKIENYILGNVVVEVFAAEVLLVFTLVDVGVVGVVVGSVVGDVVDTVVEVCVVAFGTGAGLTDVFRLAFSSTWPRPSGGPSRSP